MLNPSLASLASWLGSDPNQYCCFSCVAESMSHERHVLCMKQQTLVLPSSCLPPIKQSSWCALAPRCSSCVQQTNVLGHTVRRRGQSRYRVYGTEGNKCTRLRLQLCHRREVGGRHSPSWLTWVCFIHWNSRWGAENWWMHRPSWKQIYRAKI